MITKKNDRFFILVFEWAIKDALFFERKRQALLLDKLDLSSREYVPLLSDYQEHSRSMLMAYSAFFFTDAETALPGTILYFVGDTDKKIEYFIIVDVLKLKTQKGDLFEVSSLFPVNLLNR